MNKNIKAAVYMRVATFEQVDDRTNKMKEFADKNGYEISDFIVEQRSSLAVCSKTLYGLLHNQSVKTILTPTLGSFSRNILVTQDILNTAKRNNKKMNRMDLNYKTFLCHLF